MTRNNGWTGERLRVARGRLRHPDGSEWTQKDVADYIQAGQRTYAGWEREEATPQAHFHARLDDLFSATPPSPAEEDRTNPRIKQATLAELLAEAMVRVAQNERSR